MSLDNAQVASLAAAFGTQAIARVKDDTARNMARALVTRAREQRVTEQADSATRARDYAICGADTLIDLPTHDTKHACTRCEHGRMHLLLTHYWPRARRVVNAMRAADAESRIAYRDHDKDAVYAYVLRAHRLSVLAERMRDIAYRVGSFPVSAHDRDVTTSRFIVSAKWRRFMFAGGRDRVSSTFTEEDILQGAFERALIAGDTASGVPMFGVMFGYVQAERAHLTRTAGAEWRGIRDALIGARAAERAYPESDDKHTMRLLGLTHPSGKPYGDRNTHAAAMADEYAAVERERINDRVSREAREFALLAADKASFATQLATVLMGGTTLAEVADALGLTVSTIRDRVLSERDAVLRSGIDHTTDDDNAERDVREFRAMTAHAARAREARLLAERADYLRNHGAIRAIVLSDRYSAA